MNKPKTNRIIKILRALFDANINTTMVMLMFVEMSEDNRLLLHLLSKVASNGKHEEEMVISAAALDDELAAMEIDPADRKMIITLCERQRS